MLVLVVVIVIDFNPTGTSAYAQELEIAVSPSPVGSGARAAGMADAFVAVADDATAASWNPAGLVQLELPELSVVGSFNSISEDFSAPIHREVDSSHGDSNVDLNYLSFVYPLPLLILDKNVCVSLNYQRKYDFSRKFTLHYNTAMAASLGTPLASFTTMDFEQQGGLSAITPAVAVEVTRRLSLGLSLNIWHSSFLSDNSWQQHTRTATDSWFGPLADHYLTDSQDEYKNFHGLNAVAGLLWNVTDKWSLAARYDTAFTGKAGFTSDTRFVVNTLFPEMTPFGSIQDKTTTTAETRRIRFPASVALGTAYRFSDRFTLSFDVTRTDWNDFYVKDAQGARHSLVDFSNIDDTSARTHFQPTYTVRLGAEYAFIPRKLDVDLKNLWTLRGGLFYDEEPATHKPPGAETGGSGKPDPFYGLAFGVGWLTHQRVNVDLAYQLRWGSRVNADFIRGIDGFKEDTLQHRVLLSTVVYF